MIQPAKKTLRATPPQVDPNVEAARQQKAAKRMQQLMMLATIGAAMQGQGGLPEPASQQGVLPGLADLPPVPALGDPYGQQ